MVVLYLLVLLWVVVAWHPTPLYQVETDLIGEYIPAALELRHGEFHPQRYTSKGFGYPLSLAATSLLIHDPYLAARLLNVIAAAAGAWFTFVLFGRVFGAGVGLATLLALILNPAYVQGAIEAGTDLPAFALSIASTALLLGGVRSDPRAGVRAPSGGWRLGTAGFLAGYALITRYATAFLPAAAILVLAVNPHRWRRIATYAAGFAIPLGAWLIVARGVPGSILGGQNVMNVAYEFYGRGMNAELFWEQAGGRFGSIGDVVRQDPGWFFRHLATNLATRWITDVQRLLLTWMGPLAIAGMLLGGWRARAWPLAIHFALGYAVLATTFYMPRFAIYLLPFYLSGAAWLVFESRFGRQWLRPATSSGPEPMPATVARAALWTLLVGYSASVSIPFMASRLREAPHEVRECGELLRADSDPAAGIMARKPHVAYFAGLRHVPLPNATTFGELLAAARQQRVRYLFFSAVEAEARPQFVALVDSGVGLPGLEQVAYRSRSPLRFFTLYRFTGERVDSVALDEAALAVARAFAAKRPGNALAQTYVAGYLIEMGRPKEALPILEMAERANPGDPRVARLAASALYSIHDLDAASAVAERALEAEPSAWAHDVIGLARLHRGRWAEARGHLEEAVRLDPTRKDYIAHLALARACAGDPQAAAPLFRSLGGPAETPLAVHVARTWLLLDESERASHALAEATRATRESPDARAIENEVQRRGGGSAKR